MTNRNMVKDCLAAEGRRVPEPNRTSRPVLAPESGPGLDHPRASRLSAAEAAGPAGADQGLAEALKIPALAFVPVSG